MLAVLYWLSLVLGFVGMGALMAGIIGKADGLSGIGLIALAGCFALFGVWTTTTISGFLGGVLLLGSAGIGIMVLKSWREGDARIHAQPSSPDQLG